MRVLELPTETIVRVQIAQEMLVEQKETEVVAGEENLTGVKGGVRA